MEEQEWAEKIIGCAMKTHSSVGPGLLESVYQKALAHELKHAGLRWIMTVSLWAIFPPTCWPRKE